MQTDKMDFFFKELKLGLENAERKHPVFCDTLFKEKLNKVPCYSQAAEAFQIENDRNEEQIAEMVIKEELYEMLEAAALEKWDFAFYESVDLAVTALRAMEYCYNMAENSETFKKSRNKN